MYARYKSIVEKPMFLVFIFNSVFMCLCHLQFSLMTEIRGLILPKDIDKFDTEVMEREVEAMKVHKYIIISKQRLSKSITQHTNILPCNVNVWVKYMKPELAGNYLGKNWLRNDYLLRVVGNCRQHVGTISWYAFRQQSTKLQFE